MTADSEQIDLLLKDICAFLNTRKENLELTNNEREQAETLIERSKTQLEHIIAATRKKNDEYYDTVDSQASHTILLNKETESYVDMSANTEGDSPPPLPAKLTDVQLPSNPILPLIATIDAPCPFKDLPAKHIPSQNKQGTLSLRKKVFSIIDRSCKVYSAVIENWLLIYWSCKDSKPFCALDLQEYEAKEDDTDLILNDANLTKEGIKKNHKIASSFKVFSFNSEKSSYSFTAPTHKDMLHWVESINQSHDKAVRAAKNLTEQIYEICEDPSDIFEENFYNEIDSKCSVASRPTVGNERPLPELPAKPFFLSGNKSSSDPERIYHEVSTMDKNEEDADQTYYELATVRTEVKNLLPSSENYESDVSLKHTAHKPNLINLNKAWTTVKKNAIEISSRHSKASFPPPSDPILMVNSNVIVKMMRHRFSMVESPNRNLETFSTNLKLETFQASPPKENFQNDLSNKISHEFKLSDSIKSTINSIGMEEDQPPMVLLKADVMGDDETTFKKVKKSPTVPVKPKKMAKKLNF